IFNIGSKEICYQNEVVYKDESSDDALAQLFHNSGITEIRFSPDFGFEESNLLLKTIKSFVNREKGNNDLVLLLWQADITGFDYYTVEDVMLREYDGGMLIQESTAGNDPSAAENSGMDDSDKVVYSSIFLEDDSSPSNPESTRGGDLPNNASMSFSTAEEYADRVMGFERMPARKRVPLPDTALILNEAFTLGDFDRTKLEEVLRQDAEFDMYRSTISLLFEVLVEEKELSEFGEAITVMEKMQSEFLRAGRLQYAGHILEGLQEIAQTADRSPKWQERIKSAIIMAGSKEKLDYLTTALNNNAYISPQEIDTYLSHFGWEALSAITGLLGELEHEPHRKVICNYLIRAGKDHVDIISRGIFDRRWFVVRNTVSILISIGGEKAYAYLEKVIRYEDPRVRLQVVRSISGNRTQKGTDILVKLMWDKDDLIKQTVWQSLLELDDAQILHVVTTIINNDQFTLLDASDQEKLLITFSKLGGEPAAAYLGQLVKDKFVIREREQDFYQQAAFKALGYNCSEKAEKILLKCNHSWNKQIRKMAGEALKHRRKVIYGEES
ncbi:MAG: HEAT repeat domain-containing protein, partial [candidate division Zixibacteria bacterium]|nr:HEAT repeat domain-containing protein [candidate division Zixibacteria bacterium]